MERTEHEFSEDRISFIEMIEMVLSFIRYLRKNFISLLIANTALGVVIILYLLFRSPIYTAETTFVVMSGSGQSGNISSLANVVGINLNAFSDESSLFQEDNILELYKSRRMIYETFLVPVAIKGDSMRLITYWSNEKELIKKWRKHLKNDMFSFEIPIESYTVKHDSLIFEVIKDFKEQNLLARKPDRLLSILSVQVKAKDPVFAKNFNEILVKKVNDFYLETETKKTGENLDILSRQADSVRKVLHEKMQEVAIMNEQQPNLNPLYHQVRVDKNKAEIDLQANATIYQEVVKNLEIAKITHRNNTPLIQVIDYPRYPLPDNTYSIPKAVVFGLFIAFFIVLLSTLMRYIWLALRSNLS
jgi:uncharacterized protein involved in exopolysaccharide biosynthesis